MLFAKSLPEGKVLTGHSVSTPNKTHQDDTPLPRKGLLALKLLALFFAPSLLASSFHVGTGIHDITGPASNLVMNGYVRSEQTTAGIHTRLHARAFVITDADRKGRVVLVNTELCNLYEGVKGKVVEKLNQRFGSLYDAANVHIAANHTHSGPAGYSHHNFYSFRVGFSPENFRIIVEGIFQAIVKAHENLVPARVFVREGDIIGGNINRSPLAYLRNPKAERDQYEGDTDTTMTLLGFESQDGKPLGAYSWYPVHNTSMDYTNRLISSDNKGMASLLWEKAEHRDYFSSEGFVAAFANSNSGDVSPGISRDVDGNGDWECEVNNNFLCTYQSGEAQFTKARELFSASGGELAGPIDYRHLWVNFGKLKLHPPFVPAPTQTCRAAIGVSMLAGSEEDGPGVGREGVNCSKAAFPINLLCRRDRCQGQKPVVLQTGKRGTTPEVLPLQLLRIGSLAIVGVPVELTTMAGRRVRKQMEAILKPLGIKTVVIGGYANSFASYVTTREEYQEQDYEGASTQFGEWTLSAYQQELGRLAHAMVKGATVVSAQRPPSLPVPKQITRTSLGVDRVPSGKRFGEVLEQPEPRYLGGKPVEVVFLGGQLSHDPHIQNSFLEVQKQTPQGWKAVSYDWDPDTHLYWSSPSKGISRIKIVWLPGPETEAGVYRILHRGAALVSAKQLLHYEGVSRPFEILTHSLN